MATVVEMPPAPAGADGLPTQKAGEYPTGLPSINDELMAELSLDELKAAFRIFDDTGEGFIRVLTFRNILKEIDEDFTDEELDGIISDIDSDGSGTIDFDEFCNIME
eukprot:TRINITY_DN32374_c0_g1_i1.p2 TRINITY_DN32374_c0_g1~~TRINITY_DN32374_c0_g1_i1.p2  ORF type:complete len:107 (-),score=33.21 TRINITY_DN32374_c0_g1_i1:80-400(-)